MTDTSALAPSIAKSEHKGTWTRTFKPGTYKSASYLAGELAAIDGEFVVWESAGHLNGDELFVRARFIGQPDGSLAGYASDGHLSIIHPADRRLVILTK